MPLVPQPVPDTLLATMGFDPAVVRLYAQLRVVSGSTVQAVSELLGEEADDVAALARPLVEADACLVRAIENAQADNPSLGSTILAYVGHPDFILRREPATGGTCQ